MTIVLLSLALAAIGAEGATTRTQTPERESIVRDAMMRLYIHGVTEEIAHGILQQGDLAILRKLLADASFPRRDNVVAFLAMMDRGESTAALLAFLATGGADPGIPEEDRALLMAPQALGVIAGRGDHRALEALMEMTESGAGGGALGSAAARAADPVSYLDDLFEQALRGLAYSKSREARLRLERIERGAAPAAVRDLAPAARRALQLLRDQTRGFPFSVTTPGVSGALPQIPPVAALAPREPGTGQSVFDTQPTAHGISMTYANHVSIPSPMTDSVLDAVLRSSSFKVALTNYAEDVSCCVVFSRSGTAQTFGAPGDGLDIVDDGAELVAIFNNPVARVKVVRQINACGGGLIFGCAGASSFVVTRQSFLIEDVLWVHELGHNAGLGHSTFSRDIMYPFVDQNNDGLEQFECTAFHQPQIGSGIAPVNQGACADSDVDGLHDAFDNCPLLPNPIQADYDADGAGDSCDPDDDNDLVADSADCTRTDPLSWDLPGDARNLNLTQSTNGTTLTWEAPAFLGGPLAGIRYDTLRANLSNGFGSSVCVESDDGLDVMASTNPPPTLVWTLRGGLTNAALGGSVAAAGDVNGDGFGDIILGAARYFNGEDLEGRAYVYKGSSTGPDTSIWFLEGNVDFAALGTSVASAGNVNGDAYDDVIVGAPSLENETYSGGVAFVHHGSASGPGLSADWTGTTGTTGAAYGTSVASAGDVNGDGYDDVIVGAPDLPGGGGAFVYHGSAGGLSMEPSWSPMGIGGRFGASVAGAGDVNGDLYDDVIVGAPNQTNGQSVEGVAYVYLGSSAGLNTMPQQLLEINQVGASFGISVSSAGDVDGDGYDDVIVGATQYDNPQVNEGAAFIFPGSSTGTVAIPSWLQEGNQANSGFGGSVASAGDINGDGLGDVLVGAPLHNNTAGNDAGRALLFLGGRAGASLTPVWTIQGGQAAAQFGGSVAGAGDVNGDGVDDVIVGAKLYSEAATNEGRVSYYRGRVSDPPLGSIFYYAVRSENSCGPGPLGFSSAMIPFTGSPCP